MEARSSGDTSEPRTHYTRHGAECGCLLRPTFKVASLPSLSCTTARLMLGSCRRSLYRSSFSATGRSSLMPRLYALSFLLRTCGAAPRAQNEEWSLTGAGGVGWCFTGAPQAVGPIRSTALGSCYDLVAGSRAGPLGLWVTLPCASSGSLTNIAARFAPNVQPPACSVSGAE